MRAGGLQSQLLIKDVVDVRAKLPPCLHDKTVHSCFVFFFPQYNFIQIQTGETVEN